MPDHNDATSIKKDFDILKGIASALIQENADLKNDIDEKERELNLLYKVLREITYSMDWHEIQKTLLDIVMDFFPVVSFCLIALFDTQSNGIRIKRKQRDRAATESDLLVFQSPVNDDTSWDEIVASAEWSEYFYKLAFDTNMQTSFIPLKVKSRELGFLMVGKPAAVKYGKGEWRFLRTIANHLAITLENAELYLLASTDELTSLFNRRYFDDRLSREIDRASRRNDDLSLLMLDIDHFKTVNDMFGHQSGDEVLIAIARRLRDIVGEKGIVCRYGGEEYTAILPGISTREAVAVAEEIRTSIGGRPFIFSSDGETVEKNITISIGVSSFPKDTSDPTVLINKADQALYLAKAEGRNKVISHQRLV